MSCYIGAYPYYSIEYVQNRIEWENSSLRKTRRDSAKLAKKLQRKRRHQINSLEKINYKRNELRTAVRDYCTAYFLWLLFLCCFRQMSLLDLCLRHIT